MPSGSSSLAFINAIEVVSVPDDLIADSAQTLNPVGGYQGLSQQALETVYRINMGGPNVSSANDTLWRTWVSDQEFLRHQNLARSVSFSRPIKYIQGGATRETVPEIVYATATELAESSNTSNSNFNVTWQFTVDSSSSFLVRMHFCDIVSKALNQLYFNVYINGWYAVPDLDLSTVTSNSLATAYYVDFVVSSDDASGKLNISIGPSASANVLLDGILNGLEIMKMNISASGFDGQHFILQPGSKNNTAIIVGSVLGSISAVIIAFVLFMLIRKGKLAKWQRAKSWVPFSNYGHSSGSGFSNRTSFTSGQNSGLGLRFSFIILQEATKNFDENKVIGVGGFGKVYKGVLRDGTEVAAKRGNPKSQQGLNEFRTEIELLSRLRHRHLVSLIGFCDEHNEMILVYEYMEKGTLKSHLYGSDYANELCERLSSPMGESAVDCQQISSMPSFSFTIRGKTFDLTPEQVQSDHFDDFFGPQLETLGYQSVYMKRTSDVSNGNPNSTDGCAIFFRRARFTFVKKYEVQFNKVAQDLIDSQYSDDNKKVASSRFIKGGIALILILEANLGKLDPDKPGKHQLLCVNQHEI